MNSNQNKELYIGLMSGTSLDGVDGVLAQFSQNKWQILAYDKQPFSHSLYKELLALQTAGPNEIHRSALAANELAEIYARCSKNLCINAQIKSNQVKAMGVHGQTIRHCPHLSFTCQLNNPALVAELSHINTIADFRSRDIAAGGQGAPLVPLFHRTLFNCSNQNHQNSKQVVCNIGGIANISIFDEKSISGFDTGPGNTLLDYWAQKKFGKAYDDGGQQASLGKINDNLLNQFLKDDYFSQLPPKSTGRDLFNGDWLNNHLNKMKFKLKDLDVLNTLSQLTARTIAQDVIKYAENCCRLYLCGGGVYNKNLIKQLQSELNHFSQNEVSVLTTIELGIPPECVEALAFAWFAKCFIDAIPANSPSVTGAKGERILGALYPA